MMSREIKFRTWYPKSKQMFLQEDWNIGQCLVYKRDHPNDIELMQFTGLKDRNGKEIFEGDIIRLTHDCYENPPANFIKLASKNAIARVSWWLDGWSFNCNGSNFHYGLFNLCPKSCDREVKFLFMASTSWKQLMQCEVIGNVWEHPHLLESK